MYVYEFLFQPRHTKLFTTISKKEVYPVGQWSERWFVWRQNG